MEARWVDFATFDGATGSLAAPICALEAEIEQRVHHALRQAGVLA